MQQTPHPHRTLAAVGAALAAVVLLTTGPSAAGNDDFVPATLITSEVDQMGALAAPLARYLELTKTIGKRQPTASELAELERLAAAAKAAIPSYQQGLSSVIRKLQTASKWTPELDAYVEKKAQGLNAADAAREIRSQGGARALLQKAEARSRLLAQELDADLRERRGRSGLRLLLEPLLGTPVHARLDVSGSACITVTSVRTVCFLKGLLCVEYKVTGCVST